MIDENIIKILNLVAVISVPLITIYIFKKERIEKNRPILFLDKLKNNDSIVDINVYMFNCGIAFNETEKKLNKVSKVIDLYINNIGVGIAYKINIFYVKDNNKRKFTKLTFKHNVQYNYGINLKPDCKIKLSIDSIDVRNKIHNFIVCYEDVYKNKYIDIVEIMVSENNEKNTKIVYYNIDEYQNQEINVFNKDSIKAEKLLINNIIKIANYIKKNQNKLLFNVEYDV